jgi:tRNA threonylcarbamoyl adenosine modification protein (Sua5/YciO/YrdC/YwlC family)
VIRIRVATSDPEPAKIAKAADTIVHGGVVAMPTDTLYGLAVDPFNTAAVDKLFALKGRASDQPIPLVATDNGQVYDWIGELSPLGFLLAERFWPGPLTLVMRAPLTIDRRIAGAHHTVGVRVPEHDVTRALCAAAGRPLTATSANLSGQPATADPDVVVRTVGSGLDLLLDAGLTRGGAPSTLVDVTRIDPVLIREGAIPWADILKCVRHE